MVLLDKIEGHEILDWLPNDSPKFGNPTDVLYYQGFSEFNFHHARD